MSQILIYPLGVTPALAHGVHVLQRSGIPIADAPGKDVTHLLLDVPSFRPDPHPQLESVLSRLPETCTIVGGKLEHPLLWGRNCLDLLTREDYIAPNAAITAHCAIETALPLLKTTLPDTKTLVIGWGRIGKCLARLLRNLDCPVTVAARKEKDRCMLRALGYPVQDTADLKLESFRLLFNTVPYPLAMPDAPHTVKIDLASVSGLTGEDVISARGLPGRLAPESSGNLIAQTLIACLKEEIQ